MVNFYKLRHSAFYTDHVCILSEFVSREVKEKKVQCCLAKKRSPRKRELLFKDIFVALTVSTWPRWWRSWLEPSPDMQKFHPRQIYDVCR